MVTDVIIKEDNGLVKPKDGKYSVISFLKKRQSRVISDAARI